MLDSYEIMETFRMIEEEKLDIRTITMGISLRKCASSSAKTALVNIYDHICETAEKLVAVAEQIELEYGVPIINKRVSVTPIAEIAACTGETSYLDFARELDRVAREIGVDFIGGFSALVHKGHTEADRVLINSIPESLSMTEKVCSSVNVATTDSGINMDAVAQMGKIIKKTALATENEDGLGCARLVVFANVPEDNPFMAGAFHGAGEPEAAINVGISGPGVVNAVLKKLDGKPFDVIAEEIKKTAFKITRAGQLVAREAASRLDIPLGIIDLSLAPTPEVGDSVARILENMGLESCGAPGTTAALALLNDSVKKGGAMASPHVGGLSGAFIPVSEDSGMVSAVRKGSLTIEKLEAMTAVCSVGLDMIALPGKTSAASISGIIADEIAIGVINQKTTAVRLIPVPGKDVGDMVEFGGLLGKTPVMEVNEYSASDFIARGGRIPAPLRSLRN